MADPTPSGFSLTRVFLYSLVALCAIGAIGYYNHVVHTSTPIAVDELAALRGFLGKIAEGQKLAAAYQDANGDLVADAPSDPGKQQQVSEIGFCLVAGDEPENAHEEWKDFLTALEKGTGKKVAYRDDLGSRQAQLDALRDGKLHVTAFTTGEVSSAVNLAGFVPLAAPADAAGKYAYEMEILVPAKSGAQSPADLKGKLIGFTLLSSNSGAKAPLVILKEKFGMLPARDYSYRSTGSHELSIRELAAGRHDAVCVASDLLARAVADGLIRPEQFRSIYKSLSFPPLCLGTAHDLPPEVAAKVKKVFEEFRFAGTSLAKRYGSQGKDRFALVDYQRDWAYVREIDDSLRKLLDTK